MLTPEQAAALAAAIVSGHEERMVAAIMERLTVSLVSGGALTIADQRTLEKAAAANREEVSRILATYGRRIDRETKRLVTAALKASDTGDVAMLSSLYPAVAAGSTAAFARMAQETADGVAAIIARNNLKMAYRAQQVWYDVASEAIVAVNHGAMPIDRVMRRAVTRLSSEGISTIDYASGVKSNIDVAVRRHVTTQVSQAAARMTMARLDQYGHDLVYTSAHMGARPEHAVWQGRAFSRSGRTPGYPGLVSETSYGSVTGLLGANCGHSITPFFPGITDLPQLPERGENGMTSDELYEATQKQRRYERAVRETKREAAALQQAGLDDTQARLRLGAQQARLKAFCDKHGLPRQPLREKAYGVGLQPRALRSSGIRIGRSLGAAAKPVRVLMRDGTFTTLVEGSRVVGATTTHGRGTSKPIKRSVLNHLCTKYGGTPSGWMKRAGNGEVYLGGQPVRAHLHWYEHEGVGREDWKLKKVLW